jgi:uncharacterized membrane protein
LAAYAVVIAYFSNLRNENFFTSAWDLGVNQQLLWTTAHGQLFYETPDRSFYGVHSFLQVHSTYVAALVVPLYAAWPVPLTLFAVQSTVFAASGIPLYYLARGSLRRVELVGSILLLYFVSFAILAGLMYDFHWESFLPVEILSFFVLVSRGRYSLSLVPFVMGTMTLEVFPFLAVAVVLLVLVERGQLLRFSWRAMLKDRPVRIMLAFLVLAGVAYFAVRAIQYVLVPAVLGVAPVTAGGPGGLSLIFGYGANAATLPHSFGYWLLLLATLGFLPILAPRYLILSLPWFLYSVFVAPGFSAYFGGSQALIAVPPLTIGAVFGLRELERLDWTEVRSFLLVLPLLAGSGFLMALALVPGGSTRLLRYTAGPYFWVPAGLLLVASILVVLLRRVRTERPAPRRWTLPGRTSRFAVPGVVLGTVVAILVLDGAMSPFNTANFGATPLPGYEFRYTVNPASSSMPWIVSYIPSNGQVLASDRLFPYVANDPNAWPLPWFVINAQNPVPDFPFSPNNLPRFVLADASEFLIVPAFLQSDLFNSSVYGLVAYIYSNSFPGTIYLFELGYQGVPQVREVQPPPTVYEYTASHLSLGPSGRVVSDPTSLTGTVIASVATGPLADVEAGIWYGPYATFLPGDYVATFSVKGGTANSSSPPGPIAYLDSTWLGSQNVSTFFRVPVNASELSPAQWTSLSFPLHIAYPYPTVELRGFLALQNGRSIGWISLSVVTVALQP